MSFAEEMLNLGEKLLTSCENRIHSNKNMVRNTRSMINRFHNNNRQMARGLKNNLNEFAENLHTNTNKILRRFKNEHKEMAKNQQENLSDFTSNLSKNVGGFLKKCYRNRMGLHNIFVQAHKNFFNCMNEIERKKRHAHKFGGFEPTPHPKKRGRKKRTTH